MNITPDPVFIRRVCYHSGFGHNQANTEIHTPLLYLPLSSCPKVGYSESFLQFWVEKLGCDVLLAISDKRILTVKLDKQILTVKFINVSK